MRRNRIETALAVASGTLCIVTLFWRDWIEAVFGADPDRHNGSLEWALTAALLLVFAICVRRVQVLRRARVNSRREPGTL